MADHVLMMSVIWSVHFSDFLHRINVASDLGRAASAILVVISISKELVIVSWVVVETALILHVALL